MERLYRRVRKIAELRLPNPNALKKKRRCHVNASYRIAVMSTAVCAIAVLLLLAPFSAQAQLPTDPAERAKVIEQIFQVNARQLTLFDRQGKMLSQIGTRDMYGAPVL